MEWVCAPSVGSHTLLDGEEISPSPAQTPFLYKLPFVPFSCSPNLPLSGLSPPSEICLLCSVGPVSSPVTATTTSGSCTDRPRRARSSAEYNGFRISSRRGRIRIPSRFAFVAYHAQVASTVSLRIRMPSPRDSEPEMTRTTSPPPIAHLRSAIQYYLYLELVIRCRWRRNGSDRWKRLPGMAASLRCCKNHNPYVGNHTCSRQTYRYHLTVLSWRCQLLGRPLRRLLGLKIVVAFGLNTFL